MQTDASGERQRLAENYSKMYEGELMALAEGSDGLMETAREVLRSEFERRGLAWPEQSDKQEFRVDPQTAVREEVYQGGAIEGVGEVMLGSGSSPAALAQEAQESAEGGQEVEYSWKVQLCECEEMEQAQLLRETLRRAGIESWLEGRQWMGGYPRLLVAADQQEAARAVAAQPIPQEIVEEFRQMREAPEAYALPCCPTCKAEDPLLEGVEPTNQWLCESCGHRWADPAEEAAE